MSIHVCQYHSYSFNIRSVIPANSPWFVDFNQHCIVIEINSYTAFQEVLIGYPVNSIPTHSATYIKRAVTGVSDYSQFVVIVCRSGEQL